MIDVKRGNGLKLRCDRVGIWLTKQEAAGPTHPLKNADWLKIGLLDTHQIFIKSSFV
jgi:hypothetical protein